MNNQVLIGQPIDYPIESLLLMKNIFDQEKGVLRAYLACIQYPDPESFPKILIGLEVDGEIENIIPTIMVHVNGKNFDYMQVEFTDAKNGQFKSYFLKIKPFYDQGK